MKIVIVKGSILIALSLLAFQEARGQAFYNLDFQNPTISPTPPGGGNSKADPGQCFPGWTVGGGNPFDSTPVAIEYNESSFELQSDAAVILIGPNFPNGAGLNPEQGNYSVLLRCLDDNGFYSPTLSQTGMIPIGAQTISFCVDDSRLPDGEFPANQAVVTLNGINIPLTETAGGEMSGNIPSALDGTTATLTFSVGFTPSDKPNIEDDLYFDNVQFSTLVVPEPGVFALFGLGALSLAFWRRRKAAR